MSPLSVARGAVGAGCGSGAATSGVGGAATVSGAAGAGVDVTTPPVIF